MSVPKGCKHEESLTVHPATRAPGTWPFYDDDEIAAVVAVLRSGRVNYWTGDRVNAFERAYEAYLEIGRAIALANGSLALELALRAFSIGAGDEVIVTPRSFVASAACVCLVGATPIFADVDRDSGAITADSIAAVLGPRTRAVIPVHLAGWPADMPRIMALAEAANIRVIEDCAQAHGAEINGRPVGSFGDAAAFSFCQDKIITTGGEGGMVVFQDESAYEWAWSFKDHGKARAKIDRHHGAPGFRWIHDHVGTNWRMLETSAAIGLLQLGKLQGWRVLRRRNAEIWAEELAGISGLRSVVPPPGITHAWYKFYAFLDGALPNVGDVRDRILTEAASQGIRLFAGSCSEIYLEEAFKDLRVPRLPIARELGATSLMMEVHPTLDPVQLRETAAVVAAIVRKAVA